MSAVRRGQNEQQQTNKAGTGKRKVKFQIAADPKSEVHLAGSFNDWNPSAICMKRNGEGLFVASLSLPPGRHEYKFVVNGVWQADPACPQWVPNSVGSINSVAEVA